MRNRKTIFLARVLFCLCLTCGQAIGLRAQQLVRGIVTDERNEPLPSVVLRVYAAAQDGGTAGDSLLAYTFSNEKGEYAVKLPDARRVARARLVFSMLGFRKEVKTIANAAAYYHIRMAEESIVLKDVVVKAPPISSVGDTLVYNVAAFSTTADRTIEDVIRKLPGIEISPGGSISYKGEPINRFYIEGMDLLNGRYGLATKSISPADIASVSIYENHQPQKVLRGIEFSDKAALNLTLKNKKMLKPVGNALLGGGGNEEGANWQAESTSLWIRPEMQQLFTLKGNNFGNAYTTENTLFINDLPDCRTTAEELFPENLFDVSGIAAERYYRNRSASASANVLTRLREDLTLSLNANYSYDRNAYEQSKTSRYFTEEGEILTEEENNSTLHRHAVDLTLTVENNAERRFLKNQTRLSGSFRDNEYQVTGTSQAGQQLRNDNYRLSNLLEATWRQGKKLFRFRSVVAMAHTPLNYIHVTENWRQQAQGTAFYTRESTSWQHSLDKQWQIGTDVAFEARYDRLEPQFTQETVTPATDSNADADNFENHGYRLTAALTPFVEFNGDRLRGRLNVPLEFQTLRYNRLNEKDYRMHQPYASVNLRLYYTLSAGSRMSLNAGSSRSLGDLSDFVTQPLRTTYRDISVSGNGLLSIREGWHASLAYDYRNAMSGNFFSLKGGYRTTRNNRLAGNRVSTSETIGEILAQKNRSEMWTGYLYAAKNLRDCGLVMKLTGNIHSLRRRTLRQGGQYTVNSLVWMLNANLRKNLLHERIVFSADATYSETRQSYRVQQSPMSQQTGEWLLRSQLSLFPLKSLELYASIHYNSNKPGNSDRQESHYLDAGIRWMKKSFEIELKARNLTNRRVYTLQQTNLYDSYCYRYYLRPCEGLLTVKYSF